MGGRPVAFLNINPSFFVVHVKNIPKNDCFVSIWGLGTGVRGSINANPLLMDKQGISFEYD